MVKVMVDAVRWMVIAIILLMATQVGGSSAWGALDSSPQEPNIVICTTAHAAFDKVSGAGMGQSGVDHGVFPWSFRSKLCLMICSF